MNLGGRLIPQRRPRCCLGRLLLIADGKKLFLTHGVHEQRCYASKEDAHLYQASMRGHAWRNALRQAIDIDGFNNRRHFHSLEKTIQQLTEAGRTTAKTTPGTPADYRLRHA